MATAIYMPKAGMTMEQGVLVRWLYNVGDRVEMNEPVMEIETDKITMESEAPASGILLATLVEEGTTVPVLHTIGWIGEAGEHVPEAQAPPVAVTTRKKETKENAMLSTLPKDGAAPATPYAKALAKQQGIPLADIQATGKYGQIIARDVVQAIDSAAFGQQIDNGSGEGRRVKLSRMRKEIARRLSKSWDEIPAVTQDTLMDVTALLQLQETINADRDKQTNITINDFVLRAVAVACREFPVFRTMLEGDTLVTRPFVNIGMAVRTDTGLLVPVIHNADALSLYEISAQSKVLSLRARANTLLPDAYAGRTLTVSNLGMYGVESFTPIINQPDPAIIGVCAIRDELALQPDGVVYNKKVMRICVTLDHRIMDGALAAQFAMRVREMMQQPRLLL